MQSLSVIFIIIEVDCGNPGIPVDGGTTVNSTTLDSVAIHNCDDGFLLVGESQRICLESGEWSAPLPTCERKHHATNFSIY